MKSEHWLSRVKISPSSLTLWMQTIPGSTIHSTGKPKQWKKNHKHRDVGCLLACSMSGLFASAFASWGKSRYLSRTEWRVANSFSHSFTGLSHVLTFLLRGHKRRKRRMVLKLVYGYTKALSRHIHLGDSLTLLNQCKVIEGKSHCLRNYSAATTCN